MTANRPSEQLIYQRIRNRLIEYFEMVHSCAHESQTDLNELICSWKDWVYDHPVERSTFSSPVFTEQEFECLYLVDRSWEAFADATPNPITNYIKAIQLQEWHDFVKLSDQALQVFRQRGCLPEEHEI